MEMGLFLGRKTGQREGIAVYCCQPYLPAGVMSWITGPLRFRELSAAWLRLRQLDSATAPDSLATGTVFRLSCPKQVDARMSGERVGSRLGS